MKFDKHWTQKIIFKPLILRATAIAFFNKMYNIVFMDMISRLCLTICNFSITILNQTRSIKF